MQIGSVLQHLQLRFRTIVPPVVKQLEPIRNELHMNACPDRESSRLSSFFQCRFDGLARLVMLPGRAGGLYRASLTYSISQPEKYARKSSS